MSEGAEKDSMHDLNQEKTSEDGVGGSCRLTRLGLGAVVLIAEGGKVEHIGNRRRGRGAQFVN